MSDVFISWELVGFEAYICDMLGGDTYVADPVDNGNGIEGITFGGQDVFCPLAVDAVQKEGIFCGYVR